VRSAKADALAKAAIQATARALHTAQLAKDAYGRVDGVEASALAETARREALMEGLRDRLMDAFCVVGDVERRNILATPATITSDELIDLLAMCIKG
jgi:hypothetical protein